MNPAISIAITGACSTLARSIVRLLDADKRVGSILALDIRPYQGVPSAKLRYQRTDVRDAQALKAAFAGVEAVIHLAFVVVNDVPDRKTIYEVNVVGSKNVAQAAADTGVKKLIYTSSVSVYGMLPDNPPVLTEDRPIRGQENKDHYYASTKAAVETYLEDFARAHPEMNITRFRAHLLSGPNFLRYSGNLFLVPDLTKPSRSYWSFCPKGINGSRVQYTHEQDLARAIQHALYNPMPGAFNIAGEPLDLARYLCEKGKKFRRIPRGPAQAVVTVLSAFSSRMRVARAWMAGTKYRNIMDCSKIKRAGFTAPLRTTRECLEEANAYFALHRGRAAEKSGGGERAMAAPKANFMGWAAPGWAAVTGASSGIGEEFARQLASQGFALVLVARRAERLKALKKALVDAHGVKVETVRADLSRPEEIVRLGRRLHRLGNLDVLVNNAGFSTVGPFAESDLGRQLAMQTLHTTAPVILTRMVLPDMIRRNRGVLIFNASLSALRPSPGSGLYPPTKAFLAVLARSLQLELRGTDLRVQALCPGYTRTEFHDHPAFQGLKAFLPEAAWGTSRGVVRASLRGARRSKGVVIPGALNRLTMKLVPERTMLKSFMKKRWDPVRRHESPHKTG